MTTYVIRNGELVPKETAPPRAHASSPHAMPDIAEFKAPDGSMISSRSHLRAYEQRTGTRQVGNDYVSQTEALRYKVHGEKAAWFKRPKN